MAAWSTDGVNVHTAIGHDEILEIPGLLNDMKCAHNAQFERVCLAALDSRLRGPRQWVDTMSLAAEYGYPRGLDSLAKALKVSPKDPAGAKLVRLFTVPARDGSWNDETTHPLEWLDFISYCEQDVRTLAAVHLVLGGWPTRAEKDLWWADQRINDRGLRIDAELCEVAAQEVAQNRGWGKQEFAARTGVDNPNSVPQVMKWAAEAGLDLPNLRAESIQELLKSPEVSEEHKELLELRQDIALAAGGKFSAALEAASPDGRIRGSFVFFGAHTGRWAGRGVQPQNLPRATIPSPEAAICDLHLGLGATPHELKALVRSIFIGPLTVVDYSAIEARVVAWLAGEEWALQAFRDGRDIYQETADRMGSGMTRFHGKVAVLALGYNGGINSLRAMGAEGTDDELQRIVTVWRKTNARIVKLWAEMQEAIEYGGGVGKHLRVVRTGSSMRIELPSGRALHYHDVVWARYRDAVVKEGWRYANPRAGGAPIGTYGGRLVENVTQAIARDILGEALVRLEEAGYRTVGHVHDEAIVETTEVDQVVSIMTQTPTWATGLPIEASGFATDRYRKE